ncbi:MAG: glycosyltransferase family 4 protein, partial [Pseudomonadota bacterium]
MNAVNKELKRYTHIFIHDDASPEGGGIQSTTYWMSTYMGAKGFKVVVAGRLDRSAFEGTGVEVYPLKTPFRTTHTSDIRLFLLLLRLRVRYGRRVMLYSLLINNIKVARWMGAFIPWPCISFVHGNETLRLLHRKPGTLRKNLRRCLCVFSNSRYTAGLVTRLGEMENLIVLPPGIPADRYRHDPGGPDTRYEKYRDRKTVLMLSRLVKRKGHSTVIRSIARLRSKYPDILLLIAGSGGYRSQIEQMIDVESLQNQVELLGFIPEKDKPALYDACHVYCMPS